MARLNQARTAPRPITTSSSPPSYSPASSDYGPDFDTDDEELIGVLLADVASRQQRSYQRDGSVDKELSLIDDGDLHEYDSNDEGVNDIEAIGRRRDTAKFRPEGGQARGSDVPITRFGVDGESLLEAGWRRESRIPLAVPGVGGPAVEVEYDLVSRETWSERDKSEAQAKAMTGSSGQGAANDGRPQDDQRRPLDRFRSRRPLSVTDMVSPAWCELQYFFSLSRWGRVRRTQAMKDGSKVHQKLESQVHDLVPIEVLTAEDAWGLRIWNVIQGLRALRATGLTRELEVWAVVGGEVINGVIDEISYQCPDPDLEKQIDEEDDQKLRQSRMDDDDSQPSSAGPTPRRIYLTDIKTRAVKNSKTLPGGAALRQTHMQLMLYRQLLSHTIASSPRDALPIFARYGVNSSATFSNTFVRQISALDSNFSPSSGAHNSQEISQEELLSNNEADDSQMSIDSVAAARSDGDPDSSVKAASQTTEDIPIASAVTSANELLRHNSIALLWSLMLVEYSRTFHPPPHAGANAFEAHSQTYTPSSSSSVIPDPSKLANLSPLLRAEYRVQGSGELIGQHVFRFERTTMERYVADELRFWRGERPARGVDVQEAFKCGICEFASSCEWRAERVREEGERKRLREEKGAGDGGRSVV